MRPPRSHPDAASPETALRHFRDAARAGRVWVDARVIFRLSELGVSLEELPEQIRAVAEEIRMTEYQPVADPFDPPGHGFVYFSRRFRRRIYVKFRLEGGRPRVKLYSFHPADYPGGGRASGSEDKR